MVPSAPASLLCAAADPGSFLLCMQSVFVAIPSTDHGFALHIVLLARLLRFTRVLRLMKVSRRFALWHPVDCWQLRRICLTVTWVVHLVKLSRM